MYIPVVGGAASGGLLVCDLDPVVRLLEAALVYPQDLSADIEKRYSYHRRFPAGFVR